MKINGKDVKQSEEDSVKHTGVILLRYIFIAFIAGILILPAPSLFCQYDPQTQAIKSFRITPKKTAGYKWIGAVYNPNLDLYIVFFDELSYTADGPVQKIYSQPLNRKGKKAGSLYPVRATQGWENYFPDVDVTMNARENEILFVWTDESHDEIGAIALNGEGKHIISGGGVKPVVVKPSSQSGTGSRPQVEWISSRNLYAIAWSYWDYDSRTSLDNGFYLAVLNKALKRTLKPTKIRQQTMKNEAYIISTLLPLEDRLLWGASQDSAKKIKPVVWFTDFKGEVITGPATKRDGSIFPGKKVKGEGDVYAAYNRYYDQHLLMWNAADRHDLLDQTFRDTYFRIMNSDGSFMFKKRKMPKKFRFHSAIPPIFNPIANNFLVVYMEHKILYQGIPYQLYYGGRIWVTYIDEYGNLGLPDDSQQEAYPLTDVFTDKATAMIVNQVTYNPLHNEYLVAFSVADTSRFVSWDTELWGIILK